MKKTTLFAATLFGASALAVSAFAQTTTLVPGSQTGTEANVESQKANAAESEMAPDATTANTSEQTIVPGNTQEIENNNADERNAVAAGTADKAAPTTMDPVAVQPSDEGAPGNAEDMSKPNTSATQELNKPKTMQK